MPLDVKFLFEPRTMLEALRQKPPVRRFFRRTFFQAEITHVTNSVDIDIQKTKRRLAAVVNPAHSAKVVEHDGYCTLTTRTGYLKEKIPTRVSDLLVREMGRNVYDPISPMERAAAMLGEDLQMLTERFDRREELMCAQALLDGKIELKGEGVDDAVDFGYVPGEHQIVLSGGDAWNSAQSDPMRNLDDWRIAILKRCGVQPTHLIVGRQVYWAIVNHPLVKERLDNRRVEMGLIKPGEQAEGVRYLGTLQPSGFDVYSYDEWYTDPADGQDKPIMPEDMVLIASTNARCTMNYGLIQNLKNPVAVSRFPSSWMEEDGSARWLQLESAPLPNIFQPDAFLAAHVIDDA